MSDLDSRGMMKAIYDVISQPSGERDWESIRPLYHPRATMTRTGVAIDTLPANQCLTFDEYIKTAEENLAGAAFEESEIGHECARLGSVAQVRSVYQTIYRVGDREIHSRGVNFITMARLADSWQILSIAWDNERAGVTIPDEWLD
ncbi:MULTISPECIES: nuclear transport factor 2 family protein [unclassified Hyphomonas]|jgi:hypothetical protein|uniref:nuclear transport factor 2 family protein n=1 Tax=unclassified Hyphomonas TaxID=2630699 RepID=UPI000458A7D8|nr:MULTISPECIES: nuclear transport factor 2 family protein [unclassified Hyphomonas]KCZ46318.1 hypothetical protein HY17_08415 [Hyphomonas sp. CY54-11-8]RAN40230.1 hypothetical protein HY26_12955 [Hyphomonas sp. GM-8P]